MKSKLQIEKELKSTKMLLRDKIEECAKCHREETKREYLAEIAMYQDGIDVLEWVLSED